MGSTSCPPWAVAMIMSAEDVQPPPGPYAETLAFKSLITRRSKAVPQMAIPKFIKRLEEFPTIDLPPLHPMQVAISLENRALVGQFTGLWPSLKTTDNWIQKKWRPLISNSVTCYAIGRGFFLFKFIAKED